MLHTMAGQQVLSVLRILLLLLSILPVARGDSASDNSLAGLVVAGAIAFILLIVTIVVLAIVLSWNRWYPAIQRSRGRVKMPKSYWQKKKEAKQRLLMNTSRRTASTAVPHENGGMNGSATLANRAQDTGNPQENEGTDTASWVQGWNNVGPPDDNAYEDVTLTMDLGEEKEEPEFRIETSVVDDETLDLGPFKSTEDDPTYTAVLPRPRPQETPTTAAAAATTTTTDVVTTTSGQTATMQMGDEEAEETAPKRESFYMTPLMDKPRQVTSSDTPTPPPLPPPPPEESYAQFLDSSIVVF